MENKQSHKCENGINKHHTKVAQGSWGKEVVQVTFRLCWNEKMKWKWQDHNKCVHHGSALNSTSPLRGSVLPTCTN